MITIDELKAKLGGMKTAVDDLRDALSIEASEKRLAELEHQMTMPGFYDDQARSQKIIGEMGEVKNKLERFGKLATLFVADVARRSADQAGHGGLLHVFAHVDAHHGLLVIE